MYRHSPAALTPPTISATVWHTSLSYQLVNSVTQLPQRPISTEIGGSNRGNVCLMTRRSLGGNAGKKYQKRLNTRGKRFPQRATAVQRRQDRYLICIVGPVRLKRRSFWLLGVC